VFKLPVGVDINNLIDDLRIISWKACDIFYYYSKKIKDNYFDKELIKYKNLNDPVTIADLKVNNLIISEINRKYSSINWGFLSEEKSELNINNADSTFDWLWVLDPLDGTKDFIQNTGEYAMHLALNHKNIPILGVVLIPSRDELWIADGVSVWCENRNGNRQKPSLLNRKRIKDMTIVTSKNHTNKELKLLIDNLGFSKTITMGSIGFKITSIMRGDSDVYISLSLPGKSSPKDWDFAAPEIILSLSGGSITDIDNKKLIYNKKYLDQSGIIIASNNKEIHKDICYEVKRIVNKNNILFS
tara:strand:+ start:69 stop:971 length:903 start_codon:yes stop_codon:yes gene_type:complete